MVIYLKNNRYFLVVRKTAVSTTSRKLNLVIVNKRKKSLAKRVLCVMERSGKEICVSGS